MSDDGKTIGQRLLELVLGEQGEPESDGSTGADPFATLASEVNALRDHGPRRRDAAAEGSAVATAAPGAEDHNEVDLSLVDWSDDDDD